MAIAMAVAALAMAGPAGNLPVPAVGYGSDVAMACGHMAMAGAVAALAMARAVWLWRSGCGLLRVTHQAGGVPVRGAHAYISLHLPHISPTMHLPISPPISPRHAACQFVSLMRARLLNGPRQQARGEGRGPNGSQQGRGPAGTKRGRGEL